MQDAKELPAELNTCHEVILVQSNAIVAQKSQIDQLTKEREELRAEIRFLMSGKKREKFIGADQMLIEFEDDKELQAALEAAKKEAEQELEEITYTRTKARKERKPAADKFPSHLPREEVDVSIPPAFQARIDSGELFIKHYEYSEALKTIPAQVVVLRYKKPVLAYVSNPERELLVEGEANLGEKGRYHPSTAAHITNCKFVLHLPLYRQQDIYASCGLTLSRSSLDYNLELAHDVTQELPKVMLSRFLGANCIGFDDTHVTLIMPREIPKIDPDDVDPQTMRLIEKMQEAIKDKKDSLAAKMWGYTSFDPTVASALPLALINKIYDVERRATGMTSDERGKLRASETRMYLDRLREWLDGPVAANLLPASKLAGAFNYIRNHWEALNVFVTDGRLPIDNNQGERLMRRVAVGRKNWLFVGSMRAGIRNANLMTLVASAHRNDLDVTMYLESVITHMLRGTAKVEELLPDVWKAHHPEAIRTYRTEERQEKASMALEQAAKRRVRSELRKSQKG